MAPESVHILSLEKDEMDYNGNYRKWNYENHSRTPGAFRAVSVKDLQRHPPKINLYEWPELRRPSSKVKYSINFPEYAAISHVWEKSDEVKRLANAAKSDLEIHTDDGMNTISWLGLREVANAADELGCDYLWLDLFCLDQVARPDPVGVGENDGEKALQISNMANIYKRATTVIVMVGGAAAVQGVNHPSGWMDRAWTLQEAVLCDKHTWAYVRWPYTPRFSDGKNSFTFFPVTNPVTGKKDQLCLIKLLQLLEMPDLSKTTTSPPSGAPPGFKVRCLDGCATGRAQDTARTALLAVFNAKNKEWRKAGIWRSMLLRTSTHPVDVVYSVMGLFGVEVDPYRKDRDPQYLFNDLAAKTAAKGSPGWLGVGGVGGSLINRDPTSRLIPDVPIYRGQKLPVYQRDDGKRLLAGEFVDGSENYIRTFDIRFVTSSQPHIICARMLRFSSSGAAFKRFRGREPGQSRIFLSFGRLSGTCTFRRALGDRIVVVGTIASWSSSPSLYPGSLYILFVSWDDNRSRWTVTGDGYLRLNRGSLPNTRTHFIVGRGSPDIKTWPCDHGVTATQMTLRRSYGIMPHPDLGVNTRIPITWIGYGGEDVTTLDKTWHHFDIFFDTPMIEQAREIGLELPSSWPLHLVAYRSRNPPNYPDEAKPDMLFKYNKIPMQYTDIDLGRASLDTWLKINGSQLSVASYRATVQFRQRVVYLITEPDENTDPDFRRIAVALYKMESADSVYVAPTSTPTYDPYFTGIPQNIPFGVQPLQQPNQPARIFYPTTDEEWNNLYNRMGQTGDMANFRAAMLPQFGFRRQ